MQSCLKCKTKYKYCASCKYTPKLLSKMMGYCSDKCLKEDLNYQDFYSFFRRILINTPSCFERDVVRENKQELWESWVGMEYRRKYDKGI